MSGWGQKKKNKKQPIPNLNILLYQTNFGYRRNHQFIEVKLEQNSPDFIHVKYSSKTVQCMVHKYTAKDKKQKTKKQKLGQECFIFFLLFIVDTVGIISS